MSAICCLKPAKDRHKKALQGIKTYSVSKHCPVLCIRVSKYQKGQTTAKQGIKTNLGSIRPSKTLKKGILEEKKATNSSTRQ